MYPKRQDKKKSPFLQQNARWLSLILNFFDTKSFIFLLPLFFFFLYIADNFSSNSFVSIGIDIVNFSNNTIVLINSIICCVRFVSEDLKSRAFIELKKSHKTVPFAPPSTKSSRVRCASAIFRVFGTRVAFPDAITRRPFRIPFSSKIFSLNCFVLSSVNFVISSCVS